MPNDLDSCDPKKIQKAIENLNTIMYANSYILDWSRWTIGVDTYTNKKELSAKIIISDWADEKFIQELTGKYGIRLSKCQGPFSIFYASIDTAEQVNQLAQLRFATVTFDRRAFLREIDRHVNNSELNFDVGNEKLFNFISPPIMQLRKCLAGYKENMNKDDCDKMFIAAKKIIDQLPPANKKEKIPMDVREVYDALTELLKRVDEKPPKDNTPSPGLDRGL